MTPPPDDPLDFVPEDAIIEYGLPESWVYLGIKPGSPAPAKSPDAVVGTKKHYDLYRTLDGEEFELHYFRLPNGSVQRVEVKPSSP